MQYIISVEYFCLCGNSVTILANVTLHGFSWAMHTSVEEVNLSILQYTWSHCRQDNGYPSTYLINIFEYHMQVESYENPANETW